MALSPLSTVSSAVLISRDVRRQRINCDSVTPMEEGCRWDEKGVVWGDCSD